MGSPNSMIYNHSIPLNSYYKKPRKFYTKWVKIGSLTFFIKIRLPRYFWY